MAVHVCVFLLVPFLLVSLALLCRLYRLHHGPAASRVSGKLGSRLPRLLKPRTPLDCLARQRASPPSSGGEPAPAPVRSWREVKSRRGAPKRIKTEGFAC